mgnify:CR=1 FL=1
MDDIVRKVNHKLISLTIAKDKIDKQFLQTYRKTFRVLKINVSLQLRAHALYSENVIVKYFTELYRFMRIELTYDENCDLFLISGDEKELQNNTIVVRFITKSAITTGVNNCRYNMTAIIQLQKMAPDLEPKPKIKKTNWFDT